MDTAKASYNLTDDFAAKDVKIEALKLIKIFHMMRPFQVLCKR